MDPLLPNLDKVKTNQSTAFLRWAGSKKQLLPVLERHWNSSFDRYVEPFAGSACLFFRLQPARAMLGDINQELIATYLEVKYRVSAVIDALSKLTHGKEAYNALRDSETTSLNGAQKAARFIYLNRFCFNGLYRTNLAGRFNVPYGGERSGKLPSPETLRACSRQLENAHLIAGNFEKVLERVQPGDFVYLDPPYSVKAKRVFKEYNAAAFGEDDLRSLRKWLERFANMGVKFLVSYAESDEADLLKEGFYTQTVNVRRNIAGFSSSRTRSNEILISDMKF